MIQDCVLQHRDEPKADQGTYFSYITKQPGKTDGAERDLIRRQTEEDD